jgi:hypothetical protein
VHSCPPTPCSNLTLLLLWQPCLVPHSFPALQLLGCLRQLQPRLYSISSSPLEQPPGVQATVATVRYESLAAEREGVCSTFLADRIQVRRVRGTLQAGGGREGLLWSACKQQVWLHSVERVGTCTRPGPVHCLWCFHQPSAHCLPGAGVQHPAPTCPPPPPPLPPVLSCS